MLTRCRVKCSFGEKAFATSAPVLWNALTSNVRNAKSVESFVLVIFRLTYFFPPVYISLCASE